MRKKLKSMLMLLAAVMALASCNDAPEYVNLVPDDAIVVMRYDVKQIAEKSGKGSDQLKGKLAEMLKDAEMSAEARQKIDKILDDPAEAGVDLRDPLMVCMSKKDNTQEVTILGTMYDADKFTELLNSLSKETGTANVKKKGDMLYLYDNGYILAFNDDVLCARNAEGADENQAAAEMESLLAGEKNYTMKDNEFFTQMLDCDGIIQMLIMGNIYNNISELRVAAQSLPKGLDMKDVALLLDMSVDKGEATISGEVLTGSGEWEDWIKQGDDLFNPINGDMLEYVSKNGFAMMFNCDGSKLLSFLKENGLTEKAGKDNAEMAEKMLSSINGNIIIGVDKISLSAATPDVCVYAKTKDASISEMFKDMLGNSANIGYKDNMTYFVMGTQKEPFKTAQNPFGKGDVNGKLLYYYFNFAMLGDLSGAMRGGEAVAMNAAREVFDYGEISYDGNGKGQLRITMRDKSKYPLEAISEIAAKNIN